MTNGTTAPALPKPEAMIGANGLPLLAYQPDYLRDFLIGGFTIDASKIPADSNGQKWAYAGDVFRRNDGTGLWDLVSGTADAGDPGDPGDADDADVYVDPEFLHEALGVIGDRPTLVLDGPRRPLAIRGTGAGFSVLMPVAGQGTNR